MAVTPVKAVSLNVGAGPVKVISVSAVQPLKHSSHTVVTPLPKVTRCRPVQNPKVLLGRPVTVSGIVSSVRPEQA